MDNTSGPPTNRRVSARYACQLTVRYRSGADWHAAMAMDLAFSGCRLRLGEDLPRGSSLAVVFELPLRDGSRVLAVEVPGTVVWSRVEGLSRQAGILFPSPPRELHDLIESLT
jgi:hypothetical protein